MNRNTKYLVASLWCTLAMLTPSGLAWSADTALETEQVKQQSIVLPNIKREVANATGNDAKMFDISSTPHQVTITVVNSKLNDAPRAGREAEASTMASTLARAISEKAPFAQVMVIHVDYVKRTGNQDKAIQRLDFHKSPAGIFVPHSS
jgi:lipopolysaccharide biosynthesis regulator YciM